LAGGASTTIEMPSRVLSSSISAALFGASVGGGSTPRKPNTCTTRTTISAHMGRPGTCS